jgi:hypothetical protein
MEEVLVFVLPGIIIVLLLIVADGVMGAFALVIDFLRDALRGWRI